MEHPTRERRIAALGVLGQQDVGQKRRWALQKKDVGKDKKRHWVPMTLGDKEVGIDNQDAGQLRQRATKTFGNDKTCFSIQGVFLTAPPPLNLLSVGR